MSTVLREHWQGVSSEEIGARMDGPRTAEEVDSEVAREKAELEDAALNRIIQRAEAGEVAAVEWLEKRGFIHMPWKRSD